MREAPSGIRLPLASALCACFALSLLLVGGARPSAASGAGISFTCPKGPAGWTQSGVPQYYGPSQDPGIDSERITCVYLNHKRETTSVAVNYALPSDPNPVSDFTFGCGTGSEPWSNAQRVFQIASKSDWAYANFSQPVSLGDVPQFEALARTMVGSVGSLGHSCSTAVTPTQATANWTFGFSFDLVGTGVVATGDIGSHIPQNSPDTANYKVPDGAFQTQGSQSKPSIINLSAPNVPVTVSQQGKRQTLTLSLSGGSSFSAVTPKGGTEEAISFVAQVKVLRSKVGGCPAGSQGTLAMANSPASLKLSLCGSLFSQLKDRSAEVTIQRG